MFKVSTQPFNSMLKIKNMMSDKGKAANRFAKGLMEEGYADIYQRSLSRDRVALSGKNASGDTKTFILSYAGYRVKTNTLTPVTKHTAVREIDKAHFNQFDSEVSGVNKIQRLVNGHIFNSKETKRGWVK